MDNPKRKSPRLKEYDYSMPGAYFVTICTHNKKHRFGQIINAKMQLNHFGRIVEQEILNIESYYSNVQIDKYVVMPNHIHMIISLSETERINPFPTQKNYDIPNIVGKFKAGVTRNVGNAFMHSVVPTLWQRSFHDHIIRSEEDFRKIWEYIDTNVLRWEDDCFYE